MKIVSVTIQNFGSFEGRHEFRLADRGLTIVLGDNQDEPRMNSNGAGKSQIFDALDWGLFGKVPRQDHADSIINERVGKECVVVVEMADGDITATVTRMRGPKGLTFEVAGQDSTALDDSETQAKIEQWLGLDRDVFHAAVLFGQLDLMRFSDARDSDRIAIITKILQLEEIDEYLERAKERRNAVTDEWAKLNGQLQRLEGQLQVAKSQDLSTEVAAWENERAQRLRMAIVDLDRLLSEVEVWRPVAATEIKPDGPEVRELTKQPFDLNAWTSQMAKTTSQIQAFEGVDFTQDAVDWDEHRAARLRDATVVLNQHFSDVQKWQPIADQEQQVLANEQLAITAQQDRVLDLSEWDRRLAEQNTLREGHLREQDRAKQEGGRLNERRTKVMTLQGECSECGQPIDPKHVEMEVSKIDIELERQRGLWREATQEVFDVEASLLRTQNERAEHSNAHHEADKEATEMMAELRAQKGKVVEAKAFVAKATDYIENTLRPAMERTRIESNPYHEKKAQMDAQRETLRAQVAQEARAFVTSATCHAEDGVRPAMERTRDEPNPFEEKQRASEETCARLQADIDETQETAASLREKSTYYEFWVTAFGQKGLKSYILDTKLGELTDAANQWVHLLTGGTIWIRFETQTQGRSTKKLSNKLNIRVFRYNPDGSVSERNYRSWSGGEKQRVSLGIDFGLSRLIASRAKKSYDLLILDELFKHLDAAGREAVVDMLQVLRREKSSVIVVDHDEEFQEAFENRVLVRKVNGASTIQEMGHVEQSQRASSVDSLPAREPVPSDVGQLSAF